MLRRDYLLCKVLQTKVHKFRSNCQKKLQGDNIDKVVRGR